MSDVVSLKQRSYTAVRTSRKKCFSKLETKNLKNMEFESESVTSVSSRHTVVLTTGHDRTHRGSIPLKQEEYCGEAGLRGFYLN